VAEGTPGLGTAFQSWLDLHWSFDGQSVLVELDLRPDLCGPAGALEGGVVATLADVAGASAVARAAGKMVLTEHLALNYLAPGRDGPVRAAARVLRLGRADGVAEVRVTDRGRDDRLMAAALLTARLLDPTGAAR
jgi:uncharacterized protein (TIGR00369 family)